MIGFCTVYVVNTGCAKMTQLVCQNLVKSPPNLIIFGPQIAKMIKLCDVQSLFTSSDLCQCTTVLKQMLQIVA